MIPGVGPNQFQCCFFKNMNLLDFHSEFYGLQFTMKTSLKLYFFKVKALEICVKLLQVCHCASVVNNGETIHQTFLDNSSLVG